MTRTLVVPLVAAAALALTGCGEIGQAAKEGFELGKREGMLEVVGATAIEQKTGIAVDGDLSCSAQNADPSTTSITCQGTAEDGRKITLTGVITSTAPLSASDWVRGDFVVEAGGEELFRAECLGNC